MITSTCDEQAIIRVNQVLCVLPVIGIEDKLAGFYSTHYRHLQIQYNYVKVAWGIFRILLTHTVVVFYILNILKHFLQGFLSIHDCNRANVELAFKGQAHQVKLKLLIIGNQDLDNAIANIIIAFQFVPRPYVIRCNAMLHYILY